MITLHPGNDVPGLVVVVLKLIDARRAETELASDTDIDPSSADVLRHADTQVRIGQIRRCGNGGRGSQVRNDSLVKKCGADRVSVIESDLVCFRVVRSSNISKDVACAQRAGAGILVDPEVPKQGVL